MASATSVVRGGGGRGGGRGGPERAGAGAGRGHPPSTANASPTHAAWSVLTTAAAAIADGALESESASTGSVGRPPSDHGRGPGAPRGGRLAARGGAGRGGGREGRKGRGDGGRDGRRNQRLGYNYNKGGPPQGSYLR